jgi:hypothetical protein
VARCSCSSVLRRRAILQKRFDQDVRHRLGVTSDLVDFFVRQAHGLVGQQLARTIVEIGSDASAEMISSIASPSQSSPGHHVKASFGSTERPVKAASPRMRVERSESLDGAEASPTIGT